MTEPLVIENIDFKFDNASVSIRLESNGWKRISSPSLLELKNTFIKILKEKEDKKGVEIDKSKRRCGLYRSTKS